MMADGKATAAATRNADVKPAPTATAANSNGPAMAAAFCEAVSVEAASSR